ncbi:MAG: acyl-CoA dehydratase activase [Vicinamibacterales bacterium]|jgi:predicted CoA-substrate-specific enzyme activase|nr:2-hydroxyglutaryl-CoA dehydratase [Acidobacteriota bacterium]MDP7670362.1 acyl-CoA dehydratase activase [Vicinamibacterales bacterium]HJO38019.1 acyl-CoA dehydratase activase [Vicinamibacterales bacterium]|tara:strand:- start:2596 stop:3429 length:834 start_codon:yes stop_codon:yes gene_type:complete
MNWTAGIDVGSTYTKAVILDPSDSIAGRAMAKTGFRLGEAAQKVYAMALADAGLEEEEIAYVMATGYGRFQVAFRDLQVTDLTAAARGARFLFPGTRTVLDVGGQTMKASRIDQAGQVKMFRLNDKCAAGTGAFLEKTARYMGYATEDIGPLAVTSRSAVPISGVCAVFAESEVINHLSEGASPADIMQGAIVSLVERSVQLMKRVQMEPQFTIIGGIVRFPSMANLIKDRLGADVNIAPEETVQYMNAVGASVLARRRLEQVAARDDAAGEARANA